MNWLDVSGPPGSGKSTLCDPLWGPHAVQWQDSPPPPAQWHDFLNEITRLFHLIRAHWSFEAAVRMNRRSIRKMSVVARATEGHIPYVQTGLAQRGFGFGWRLNDLGMDINELRHFFRLMPVSIGVVVTKCPQDIIVDRNHKRETVKETAHENRDFMVPLMESAIQTGIEVLRERGVPVREISTNQDIESARGELLQFAAEKPYNDEASGPGSKVAVLSPPAWW